MPKTCSNPSCTQSNPQTTDRFHRDAHKPDGLRSRCKVCELVSAMEYRAERRDLLAKKQADYYARSSETARQASRQWKADNKERNQAGWQVWYEANKGKRSEYGRLYATANPDVMLEKQRKRRARKLDANGSFTEAQFQEKLAQHGSRCFYCGKPLGQGDVTRDHYIPLARGGSDSIENIVPACMSCNCRKRTKLPEEFQSRFATQ
jgi:5-methylcytosine-specific restriction endonuclease McrA